MRNVLVIILCFISTFCFSQGFQTRSSGVVTTIDNRAGARYNWYNAYNLTDTSLNGGLDTLGAQLHVRYGDLKGLWYRDSVETGGHQWVRLYSTENLDITNYWQLTGTDLTPISTTYDVGIGTLNPIRKLDVAAGSGSFYFDGERISVSDNPTNLNLLIGSVAGQNIANSSSFNTVVGITAMRNAANADYNTAIGISALSFTHDSYNVGIGHNSLYENDSSHNTALGYFSGIANYGKQNISIGSLSGNYAIADSQNVANSNIQVGTATMSGTDIASFITSNSLSVGDKYPFQLIFYGTPPNPFAQRNPLYIAGTVTSSNTITFFETFTSQGSGTTTLVLFNKQNNAIAIGYNVKSESSNQIRIGNASNDVLKMNQFVVDLTTVPTTGDVPTWDGTKYVPAPVSGGGGGSYTFVSPLSEAAGVVTIQNAVADGSTKGAASFTASDFNASSGNVSIDYNNGQAASTTLKGFLTSSDWNTFNSKLSNITGYVTAGTGVSITGSGTSGSPYVINNTGVTSAITTLNTLTASVQFFAIGGTGTIPNWSVSGGNTHTLNIPTTSASNTGLVTPTLFNTWNAKQDAITGAATTITTTNLTSNRAVISNGSGKIAVSTVTSTELGYLSGVTSNIQTQLDAVNNYAFGTLTDAANITWDYSTGYNKQVTIGGNRNISISNMNDGQFATLYVTQDATGSRTLTFPVGTNFLDGIATGATLNLTSTPNALDIVSIQKRGSILYVTMGYFHN